MPDLRQHFFDTMEVLAEKDKNVIVLVGDLGYPFMENYAKKFPDQFINCGIAEQNMIGFAAGLALAGKKPYVYSGAMFLLMRAAEQLRDDIAYANLDVVLIGTGAAGFLGYTHNFEGNEHWYDSLRNLPNILSRQPESKESLEMLLKLKGPTFIKL